MWALRGRTVLVTGAGDGIAAETARRLHLRGALVALAGDVRDPAAPAAACADAVGRLGGLDAVVVTAAAHPPGLTEAQLRNALELDVLLALWTLRAATPHLVARRGHLVVTGSPAAAAHGPRLDAYAAARAEAEALARAARAELSPAGVTVGTVAFLPAGAGVLAGPPAGPLPVAEAAEAVVRSVEARADRAWAPRAAGPPPRLRSAHQPLFERRRVPAG